MKISWKYYLMITLVLVCIISCDTEKSRVKLYPMVPGSEIDERITVQVNGRKTASDYFKNYHPLRLYHYYEASRVRFACDGAVDVIVNIDIPEISKVVLRTVGKDIPVKISQSTLSFSLPGAGNYYLEMPDLSRPGYPYTLLFFVDDLHHITKQEKMVEQEKYTDICKHGVISDPDKDQTERIQQVLNRGGKIVFPKGIYRTGNLRIVSNSEIYLAKGALIKGTDNYHKNKIPAFIEIDTADNIKVFGQGVIDANGMIAHDSASRATIHGFNISGSSNIVFEDFTIQGTNSWCVDIRYSKFFTADNIKIFSGKDGVDPDASQDVLLKNLSIQSLDDAFAIKNRYPTRSTTERILMQNCIVTSLKSSLKVGTETRALIKDVTFEDIDVYYGERGIVLYAMDGGPVENITWRNIRMSIIDWEHEFLSGMAFHLFIRKRQGSTPVKNIIIENVHTNFIYHSHFEGLEEAPLNDVKMKNIHIVVDQPKKDSCFLFNCAGNAGIEIENLTIDWQDNKDKWLGISSGDCIINKD